VLDSIETYATNQFSPVGDGARPLKLDRARTAHSATLVTLVNGTSRVIIAGGVGTDAQPLSSVEIFDPASGTIISGTDMFAARSSHTATVLPPARNARPQCWRRSRRDACPTLGLRSAAGQAGRTVC